MQAGLKPRPTGASPTATWTAQQLRNAFPNEDSPSYLLHDRDGAFTGIAGPLAAMQIQDVVTAPRSAWQNAYVERFIGSIRRECLDHVIVLSAAGLQRIANAYVAYYMCSRTHLSLEQDSPTPRPVMPPTTGRVVAIPEVNGLHHRYNRGCIVAATVLAFRTSLLDIRPKLRELALIVDPRFWRRAAAAAS